MAGLSRGRASDQAGQDTSGDAAQRLGERFAQLYYGLLAVKPSALQQFYTEESQMSRSWCGKTCLPDALPRKGSVCCGVSQITEAIMSSVGGQDGTSDEPVVVTNVESVQSSALGNSSGVMAHITGLIAFVAEGKIRRFSQSVVLEPCPRRRPFVLYIRSDIVHYDELETQLPPAALSQVLLGPPSSARPKSSASELGSGQTESMAGSVPAKSSAAPVEAVAERSPAAGDDADAGSAAAERSSSVSWAAIAASGSKASAASAAPRRQGASKVQPPVLAAEGTSTSSVSPPSPQGNAAAWLSGADGASSAPPERAAVKLWVSGIPVPPPIEDSKGGRDRSNSVRATEVKEELVRCLQENAPHISGEVLEVDRKDDRKPFAFVLVSDEKTARELVLLSKQKKVYLRGEKLVLDLSNYNTTPLETLYNGGASALPNQTRDRGSWRDEDGRGERHGGWGSGRGKGGGKRDDGWASRDRGGKGRGSRESRDDNWRQR